MSLIEQASVATARSRDTGSSGPGSVLAAGNVTVSPSLNVPRRSAPPHTRGSAPNGDFRVEVARTAVELQPHRGAWDDLVGNAIEPNVFLEPWLFLPAVEAFGANKSSLFVLVYGTVPGPQPRRELIGFFPMERRSTLPGLPFLTSWRHPYLLLGTPLIHKDVPVQAWSEALHYLHHGAERANYVELQTLHAGGSCYQALVDAINRQRCTTFLVDQHTRAELVPDPHGATRYQDTRISSSARKQFRAQRRRLAELGSIEIDTIGDGDDLAVFLEQFMTLEASGWKGDEGTAIRCSRHDTDFFRRICLAAHRKARLHGMALRLGNRPLAMRIAFAGGDGQFIFKIAYDQAFAKFSPGALLELEHIARVHELNEHGREQWVDSCTAPESLLFNRLWGERRLIHSLIIAPRSMRGEVIVTGLHVSRAVRRLMRPAAVRGHQ